MTNKKGIVPAPPIPKKQVPTLPAKTVVSSQIKTLDKGKIPPQAIDLEEVVLGAILIDRNIMSDIAEILKPEFFYKEKHQLIYKSIEHLHNENSPIDLLTVSHELKRVGKLPQIGGDFYLIGLTQRVSSSAHTEYHSRIIVQQYIKRRMIKRGNEMIEQSYEPYSDVFDIMSNATSDFEEINANVVKAKNGKQLNAKEELRKKVESHRKGEPTGLFFSISEFDSWSGGIQDREMVTIAARPGMGKTTLVLIVSSINAFHHKIPIALFSLEMSEIDLKARLASAETKIEYSRIRKGELSNEELNKIEAYYDFIDKSCLHIVDKMTALESIINKIRELVMNHGVKAVMIDYVQLMTTLGNKYRSDRTGELSAITRSLKALANELDIPIIILAQLSRAVDGRPSRRPILSDLKQSGSIEEDSDMVFFLLRMAAYDSADGKLVPPHLVGRTEFIVAKGRSTGLRNFWINFNFENFEFASIE